MSFEEQMLKSSNNVFKVTIWVLKGIDSLFEDTIFLNNGVLLFFLIDSLADKNTNQQIHKYFPRLDDPVLKMYYLILKSRCLARCSP